MISLYHGSKNLSRHNMRFTRIRNECPELSRIALTHSSTRQAVADRLAPGREAPVASECEKPVLSKREEPVPSEREEPVLSDCEGKIPVLCFRNRCQKAFSRIC
jgi:hypothetical protein